jgi:uncharacterized protein with PIN domain
MQRVTIAAMTGLLLCVGLIGCSEEEGAGSIEKQLGNAAEKATEAVSNTAEKVTAAASKAAKEAANTVDQWTDQATSDEKKGDKRADAADQQTSK